MFYLKVRTCTKWFLCEYWIVTLPSTLDGEPCLISQGELSDIITGLKDLILEITIARLEPAAEQCKYFDFWLPVKRYCSVFYFSWWSCLIYIYWYGHGCIRTRSQNWWVDSLKHGVKALLFYSGKKHHSIPITYAVDMKETYENVNKLDKVN